MKTVLKILLVMLMALAGAWAVHKWLPPDYSNLVIAGVAGVAVIWVIKASLDWSKNRSQTGAVGYESDPEYQQRKRRVLRRNASVTFVAIAVQLLGLATATVVIHAFVGIWLQKLGLDWGWIVLTDTCGGSVIWAALLFKTQMLELWFVNVRPLWAIVLGTQVGGNTTSFREVQSGWHGKFPWEVMADKAIDLQSEVLIGNDSENPLKVKTKDDVILYYYWQTTLAPLAYFLENFVKFKDRSQIAVFYAEFCQFLIGRAATKTEAELLAELDPKHTSGVRNEFLLLLGGPNTLVRKEKDRAMFTGTPEIRGLGRSPDYEKALGSRNVIGIIGENVKALIKASDGSPLSREANPDLLYATASLAAGVPLDASVYVGLDGADGTLFAALDSHGKAGSKNKNPKP